jgi:hypothetical protein
MTRRFAGRRFLVAVSSVIGVLLAWPENATAQCAMCGAAAASSRGVARGLAFSIFFLLGTLGLVVAWLVVLVVRARTRVGTTVDSGTPAGVASSIAHAPLPTGHAPGEK